MTLCFSLSLQIDKLPSPGGKGFGSIHLQKPLGKVE